MINMLKRSNGKKVKEQLDDVKREMETQRKKTKENSGNQNHHNKNEECL